jgi:hypothetical protein
VTRRWPRAYAYLAQNQALHDLFDPYCWNTTDRVPRSDLALAWGGLAAACRRRSERLPRAPVA